MKTLKVIIATSLAIIAVLSLIGIPYLLWVWRIAKPVLIIGLIFAIVVFITGLSMAFYGIINGRL